MGMGLHQSPRDARGTAEQFEADSPHFDDNASRSKFDKEIGDEQRGKRPSVFERFKRWFSARF